MATNETTDPQTATPEQPKKPYGRNWSKLIVIYLLIGAVIYTGIYYFVLSKNKTKPYSANTYQSPTSPASNENSMNSTSDQERAKKQVEEFYSNWLDPKRNGVGYKENFVATIDNLVKDGYITQKGAVQLKDRNVQYDVATCSQNPLPFEKYKFATLSVKNASAKVAMTGTYSGPPAQDKVITIDLVRSGSTWSIDSFQCQSPSVDAKHSGDGIVEFANVEQGSGAQLIGIEGIGSFAVTNQTKIYDENNKQVAFSYLHAGQKAHVSGAPGSGNLTALEIRVLN